MNNPNLNTIIISDPACYRSLKNPSNMERWITFYPYLCIVANINRGKSRDAAAARKSLRSRTSFESVDCFNYSWKIEKSEFEDLFAPDASSGETIFHELAKLGALRVLYRIQKRTTGSFVHLLQIKNYEGEFCTHVAVKYHNGLHAIRLVEVLVLMGADLNGANSCAGETMLRKAVYNRDYELAEWLCKQPQINLNARNYGGLTAYQIAYKRNDEQLKKIFRKAGANCKKPEKSDKE